MVHLLNRVAFGPRPGDIARVQQMGIEAWLDQQLHPASLPDTVDQAVRQAWPVAFESPQELFDEFAPPQGPAPRDTAEQQRMARQGARLVQQVMMATLDRHVASERQLLEVMTDFWFNHFNVFINKAADRWLTADYIERAIRPNALGKFQDLLIATAQHPAMLVYLDNATSVAPLTMRMAGREGRGGEGGEGGEGGRGRGGFGGRGGMAGRQQQPPPNPARRPGGGPTGINENYARELMELHTLGVDGGYTQADVQNVARILTGWSVGRPRAADERPLAFWYRDNAHDYGQKVVLGQVFPAGHGLDEGLRLLRMLANHPATIRHVSHELCARLVADDPPDGCVDRAVSAWEHSGGDIATIVRAIVDSPDFWAPENIGAKTKSPVAFVASALRAIGARPDTTPRILGTLQQLGEPLFMNPVPTGYPENSAEWVNSGALLGRMNFALAFASGRPGITLDLDTLIPVTPDKDALVARVNAVILGGQGTPHTLQVIRQQIDDLPNPQNARTMAVGLALGSPEFQKQ